MRVTRKVLIISRNQEHSLASSFISSLLDKVPEYGNFEFSILFCDYDRESNVNETVVRVPSLFVPKSTSPTQFYGDWWLKGNKLPLVKTVFHKSVDSVKMAKELSKMLSKVEIIHWFGSFWPLTPLFVFLSRVCGIKNYVSVFSFFVRYPLYSSLLKTSLSGFNKIIVSTKALGSTLSREIRVSSSKMQHISLGVDLAIYKPAMNKGKLKVSRGINPNYKVISWFGPIENCKYEDFCYLLKYAQSMRSLPLFFIFAFKHTIPSLYMPSTNNVKFCSNLDSIRDILDITDLVVLPFSRDNWQVGLPLTIVETLASGVPVVTLKRPGIDEAVIDGYNGLLVTKLDDIPKAIIALCKQEDKLSKMSRNARGFAERYFNINKKAQDFVNLWSAV